MVANTKHHPDSPRRIISGTTDSARNGGHCFNFGVPAGGFRFDQRNAQGVPGQCIATFSSTLHCNSPVRNSLGACGRCGNIFNYDLGGPTIQKWRSVRVECGKSECGTPTYNCGANGKCGVMKRGIGNETEEADWDEEFDTQEGKLERGFEA